MFAPVLQQSSSAIKSIEVKNSRTEYEIADTGYGKNNVKMLHVSRNGEQHTIKEFEVSIHLKLNNQKDYLKGNNEDIIATDSQKNTVYLLAKKNGINSPEEFGELLCTHFLNKYPQVTAVHIHINVYPWKRLQYDKYSGKYFNMAEHNHAFIATPVAIRYCDVLQKRTELHATIMAGIRDLHVLKTTKSSFTNFVQDEFRSLPDAEDRIFSTVVECQWQYSLYDKLNFCDVWSTVKEIILETFAGNPYNGVDSPSVQHTLYLTEKHIMKTIPQICAISMQMPNKHYIEFDISKFPSVVSGKNNDIFVPLDKPSGIIYAKLTKNDFLSKL